MRSAAFSLSLRRYLAFIFISACGKARRFNTFRRVSSHTNTHTQRQAIYSTHNFISLAPSLGNFSLTVRNTRTREQIDFPPCRAVSHCLHRYCPFSFFLFLLPVFFISLCCSLRLNLIYAAETSSHSAKCDLPAGFMMGALHVLFLLFFCFDLFLLLLLFPVHLVLLTEIYEPV